MPFRPCYGFAMKKLLLLFSLLSLGVCFAQLQSALEAVGVKNVYIADSSNGISVYGDFPSAVGFAEAKMRITEMLLSQQNIIVPGVFQSITLTVNPNIAGRANLWLRIFPDGTTKITKVGYKRSAAGLTGSMRPNGCTSSASETGASLTCYQSGLVDYSSYCIVEKESIVCRGKD